MGLGPGDLDDLTIGALRTLQAAEHVVLRTSRHPCVEALLPMLAPSCRVQSCDDLYEQHAEFADVYAAIVARVLAAAEQAGCRLCRTRASLGGRGDDAAAAGTGAERMAPRSRSSAA